MRYVGVDLHPTQLTVCYRDINGVEEIKQYPIDLVNEFVGSLTTDDKVAFEATGNSLFLYNKLLSKLSKEHVVVVNTGKFKLISQSVKKTDKNDCKLLVEYLSKDMLPEAKLKEEFDANVFSSVETRENLVKMVVNFKNQILYTN